MTGWIVVAFAAGAGYLAHAVKTWLRKIGTPGGPVPGVRARNLSSF